MAKSKAEAQKAYLQKVGYAPNKKYNAEKTKLINIRLVHSTEQDIIQHLDSVGNKSGYIKRLIREDMDRGTGGL